MMFEDIEPQAQDGPGYNLVETLNTMSIYFGWAGEAANQVQALQNRVRVLENANTDALSIIRRLQTQIIELENEVRSCC